MKGIIRLKRVKIIFNVIILIVFLCVPHLAFGPGEHYEKKKLMMVGDSYMGYFVQYYPNIFDMVAFPVGGLNKGDNKKLLLDAIANDSYDIIIFSTGVNDFLKDTDINEFESILREAADAAVKYNNFLILHTYMHFPHEKQHQGVATVDDYDKVLRKLADEYVNLLYIDMSEYNKRKYYYGDGLHYNKKFYDILYAQIISAATILQDKIYESYVNADPISNRIVHGEVTH